ncbi:DUF4198 domain-containing protein [Sphingomonas desiccabilis]|uniref:DUF4198 domain-containing protein n=1 Tax=Sphingomonas desiccabilis TaxID=429134 RepID=A0A4Q2IQX8_9SPHN|nr:DUF4198 domain-containing protein [Sphingomonas desiccabilis]MBB3912397.1 hypothetical protein [Sphingomonas desiccabilis]RXZ30527.1 DUF4198 domain-containing protein [Sphingomonas desiccabilis]
MKKMLFAALLLGLSTAARAHEVWIERDGNGPARIYLGEPAEAMPEGGDPEFAKLKAPKLLKAPNARLERKAGYLEAALPAGDVRAWDDTVFAPWGEPGKQESVVYYARAGRSEARAALPFEFVPAKAGADRFRLVRDGKPVAGTEVTLIAPDKSTQKLVTDANGEVTAPAGAKGRYLLTAALKDEGAHTTPAGPVAVLHRITTITYLAN